MSVGGRFTRLKIKISSVGKPFLLKNIFSSAVSKGVPIFLAPSKTEICHHLRCPFFCRHPKQKLACSFVAVYLHRAGAIVFADYVWDLFLVFCLESACIIPCLEIFPGRVGYFFSSRRCAYDCFRGLWRRLTFRFLVFSGQCMCHSLPGSANHDGIA